MIARWPSVSFCGSTMIRSTHSRSVPAGTLREFALRAALRGHPGPLASYREDLAPARPCLERVLPCGALHPIVHLGDLPDAAPRALLAGATSCGPAPLPLPWAQLAVDAGFHDQAHPANEFRALRGLSPREFVARRRTVVAASSRTGV